MLGQPSSTTADGARVRIGRGEITLRVTSGVTGGALLAAEVTIPAGGGPPEPEAVLALAARHGIEITRALPAES